MKEHVLPFPTESLTPPSRRNSPQTSFASLDAIAITKITSDLAQQKGSNHALVLLWGTSLA